MTSDPWEQLGADSPSGRLEAVEALRGKVTSRDRRRLLNAAATEPVGQIQRGILQLVESLERSSPARPTRPKTSYVHNGEQELLSRLEDLAAIIGHELRSVAGLIEMTAEYEFADYKGSRTASHVSRLSERINAVVKLAQARAGVLVPEMALLPDLVEHALAPEDLAGIIVQNQSADGASTAIMVDRGLFTMLLECAARNAVEAGIALDEGKSEPLLSYVAADGSFQITITNRFLGTSFELNGVRSAGRTTKVNHTGTGLKIVEYSAETLGFQWSLTGVGGVATFVLSGRLGVAA